MRMEDKIDKLADAMVTLVRTEERVITLFKRMDASDEKLVKLDSRLDVIERITEARGQAFRVADRFFWIVATAGTTTLVAYFISTYVIK
jgi:hypothetical protein